MNTLAALSLAALMCLLSVQATPVPTLFGGILDKTPAGSMVPGGLTDVATGGAANSYADSAAKTTQKVTTDTDKYGSTKTVVETGSSAASQAGAGASTFTDMANPAKLAGGAIPTNGLPGADVLNGNPLSKLPGSDVLNGNPLSKLPGSDVLNGNPMSELPGSDVLNGNPLSELPGTNMAGELTSKIPGADCL